MGLTVSTIKQVLAEKLRVSQDFLDDQFTLEELGLDSMAAAEVVLGVEERLGVRLDVAALGEAMSGETTLAELIATLTSMLDQPREAT